jgi:nitrogen regulatory protein P-II 1
MTKVEAIIQVSKLDAVKDALHEVGVEGMTVFEARGHGRQKGHTEFYRGREYTVDLIPKVKLEIVVADEMTEKVVQAITTRRVRARSATGRFFFRALTKRFGFATTNAAIACCRRAKFRRRIGRQIEDRPADRASKDDILFCSPVSRAE